MNTAQTQIKVTVSLPMRTYLENKAGKFGIPLAGYIKHLILKDIESMDYPVLQASAATEKAYKKAIKEANKGKTIKIDNINKFFEEL